MGSIGRDSENWQDREAVAFDALIHEEDADPSKHSPSIEEDDLASINLIIFRLTTYSPVLTCRLMFMLLTTMSRM